MYLRVDMVAGGGVSVRPLQTYVKYTKAITSYTY